MGIKEELEEQLAKIREESKKQSKNKVKSWLLDGTNMDELTDIDFELMDEDDNM